MKFQLGVSELGVSTNSFIISPLQVDETSLALTPSGWRPGTNPLRVPAQNAC